MGSEVPGNQLALEGPGGVLHPIQRPSQLERHPGQQLHLVDRHSLPWARESGSQGVTEVEGITMKVFRWKGL